MAIRILRSLEDLRRELDAADAAAKRSHAEYTAVLDGFVFDPHAAFGKFPRDPRAPEFRVAQLSLYEAIAGRSYEVSSEETPFDHAQMMKFPFPYSSRSTATVGDYLMTYGNLIKTLSLPLHARILEIGSGYGPLTWHLASMGYSVTCVDFSENLLAYIRDRTAGLPGRVETIAADMNQLELEGSYDVILFFESFHHCADHMTLLRKLPALLEPNGMLVLAGEPIVAASTPAVPYPWGLRMDGLSLWFISRLGWIELGFEERYLHNLLDDFGWSVVRKPSGPIAAMGIWIAKRKLEDSPYAQPMQGLPEKQWLASDAALHSQMRNACEAGKPLDSLGRTGYLLFGPYVPLDTGFFEVHWYGEAEPGSKLYVDVACARGTRILRSESIAFGSSRTKAEAPLLARLRFKVEEPASDFEFRVRLDSPTQVMLNRVELYRC